MGDLETTREPEAEATDEPVLALLARLAKSQAGCIATRQLRAAGLSERRIQSLVRRGALFAVCRGVYVVATDQLSSWALAWTALLVAGGEAQLAERSALEVHGILPADVSRVVVWTDARRSWATKTVVTLLPTVDTGQPASILVKAGRLLEPRQEVGGVPVMGVVDALLALAAAGSQRDLRKAWREADFRGLLARDLVDAVLVGRPRGASALRRVLDAHPIVNDSSTLLLSRAEQRLLAGMQRRGLPVPSVNVLTEFAGVMLRPDFFFVEEQLVVEVDGGGHDRPARQALDVEAVNHLESCGVEVRRFSDTEVWRTLEACLDDIEERLGRRKLVITSRPQGRGQQ